MGRHGCPDCSCLSPQEEAEQEEDQRRQSALMGAVTAAILLGHGAGAGVVVLLGGSETLGRGTAVGFFWAVAVPVGVWAFRVVRRLDLRGRAAHPRPRAEVR